MLFENIDAESLKQAINDCINSIDFTSTEQIIENLSNNTVWQSESKQVLSKALKTLVNTRYKELKEYLNECLTIANHIEEYKALGEELETKNAEKTKLQQQLKDIGKGIDSPFIQVQFTENETVESSKMPKIEELTNKIKQISSEIETIETSMEEIGTKVSNMVFKEE